MLKTDLVEIKRGNTGTGLLIEQDGYISMLDDNNKQIYEAIEHENGGWSVPNPFIVSAVFQKCDIKNANGRIYPEHVLKPQVELYKKKIEERRAYGECNHPADSTIDLGRIAMNIVELHWEGKTLVGKLELILSEGFRKNGIISCFGDTCANLLLNGLKIGVSSRGVGSVETHMGKYVVGSDFELICWDLVSDPSTPGAWISDKPEKLIPYIESKEPEKAKTIIEKIEKTEKILQLLR
jgi:hypothetical protein